MYLVRVDLKNEWNQWSLDQHKAILIRCNNWKSTSAKWWASHLCVTWGPSIYAVALVPCHSSCFRLFNILTFPSDLFIMNTIWITSGWCVYVMGFTHYIDVIMTTVASQITSSHLFTQSFIQTQIKENAKAPRHWPLCGTSPGPVNYPHKGPVTRKMVPFDDVIMWN